MRSEKINVFIVDDSAVVRQVLTTVLTCDHTIHVLGAASDPIFATERMSHQWPDVIIMDIEMPRMDGITFLKKIMSEHPTPVVLCSSLTEAGAATTIRGMNAGAVAFITKPTHGLKKFLIDGAPHMIETIKVAATVDMKHHRSVSTNLARGVVGDSTVKTLNIPRRQVSPTSITSHRFIAVGASTGGTQALEIVLKKLNPTSPGIVVVQHMPERFTAAFALRLNQLCTVDVIEGQHNDLVLPGRVIIAPGGRHMTVHYDGLHYRVGVTDGPPVNHHRPSVDVLFRSIATCAKSNVMGIIMTGMGEDGAQGLRRMHGAGSLTVAQNEDTCVIYGMPKAAIDCGAIDLEVSLHEIAEIIEEFSRSGFRIRQG